MSASVAGTIAQAAPTAGIWQRQLLVLGIAAAALLALFWHDAADMVAIWWNSSTYNHCLLVPPLIGWLVWQRRPQLTRLTPKAWWPGLALLALGALGWLLGHAGGVSLARHAGLVLMLQGLVIAMLGQAVARGLAFPLFFAVFAIPFGDEFLPAMQTVTAELAMGLLHLFGVPALLEGVFITTPAGYFEVAEACAGVKFLVAMIALGALVANTCFTSWKRRIVFLAACLIVPIIANGIRAFATIYVAEGSGVEFATGMDHVVYGGIFFAIVIALILSVAWRWFDRRTDDPWFLPDRLQPVAPKPDREVAVWRMGGLAVALAAAPMLWAGAVAATGHEEAPATLALPPVPGWQRIDAPSARGWAAHFAGADRETLAHLRDGAGHEVSVALAWFAGQDEARKLTGFGQGAVGPGSPWAWTADIPAPSGARAERLASHGETREVVSFYRVGDILTGSATRVKLETMKVRLIGGPQRAAALLVSAGAQPNGTSPSEAIAAYLAAAGPVDHLIDASAH